jgi:hypothetical protein
MSRVATRRLLDAAATLDAADRALLDIWLNRGLDDVELARMTGLDEATVLARRVRIVTHLSATLGLPPEEIRGALDEIGASAEALPIAEVTAPSTNGSASPATVTPSADFAGPPSGGTPRADAAASPAEAPAGDSLSRRRRWLWALPLTAIVVVALIVSLGSGGSRRHHSPRRVPAAARAAAPAGTPSPAPASSSAAAARAAGDPLVVLAGGPAHATGTARVAGRQSHLRLYLSVSDLPAAAHGHYEVWLYNSIIYAHDLGRLRAGVSQLSVRLPPNALRFHWIDISFQPPGAVFHSGESLLRSPNPVFRKAGAPSPR